MAQKMQQWDAAHVAIEILVALAGMERETQHSICISMTIARKFVLQSIVNSQEWRSHN